MRILKLAIKEERWDLAAHTIILATARLLDSGEKPNAGKRKTKARRPQRQPKR